MADRQTALVVGAGTGLGAALARCLDVRPWVETFSR